MPDPTPIPVRLVDFGPTVWTYLDKIEDGYRLALYLGALAAFIAVVLGTALVIVAGLRR